MAIKRRKRNKRRPLKTGLPPGTLVHTGEQEAGQARTTLITYSQETLTQSSPVTIAEIKHRLDGPGLNWLIVEGVHDTQYIASIGQLFSLHPLVLEDITNVSQRPKVENYGDYLYITLPLLESDTELPDVKTEQLSLILAKGYCLVFVEIAGTALTPVRDRLSNPTSRFRRAGADYLAYAIIDLIVDYYFVQLERFTEAIETVEIQLLEQHYQVHSVFLERLYHLKRIMMSVKKVLWSVRDMLTVLIRDDTDIVAESTDVFFRDTYDHISRIIDIADSNADSLNGMHDVYLAQQSIRLNNVMNLLTIIATIFIPLTFIAGVYGMNFHVMPELGWHWGYPACLLFMAVIGFGLWFWFRRKGWLVH